MTRWGAVQTILLLTVMGGCLGDGGNESSLAPRPCELVDDQGVPLPCTDTSFQAEWVPPPTWPEYECAVRQSGQSSPFAYDLLKPGPGQDGPFLLRLTSGIPTDGIGVMALGTPEHWVQVNVRSADATMGLMVIPKHLGTTIGFQFQWLHWSWDDDAAPDVPLDLIPTARPVANMTDGNPHWNNWLVLQAGDDHALANIQITAEDGVVVAEAPATMRVGGREVQANVYDAFEAGYTGRITVADRSDDECTRDYMPTPIMPGTGDSAGTAA